MAHTEENVVPLTEEKDQATIAVQIKGRGVYRSYKYVFMHVSRNIQPDSLKYIILETNERAEDIGPLDLMEDFDLVAMVASWKSAAIYEAFTNWRDSGDVRLAYDLDVRIDSILGDSSWSPSLLTLTAGMFL